MLREIREEANLTREEQAQILAKIQGNQWFDPENLKRWETERRLPTPRWHQLLADGYGRSMEEILQAVAASKHRRRSERQTSRIEEEEVTAVDRRKFLGAAALATGGLRCPESRRHGRASTSACPAPMPAISPTSIVRSNVIGAGTTGVHRALSLRRCTTT
ncbi:MULTISPECIES: hypothetical protein [unclassified Streptomyces]|uniref:hypothetical protein n=1 Tax=unclassified Streptomyces TaxID=2593676 RepID=UPI00380DECCA